MKYNVNTLFSLNNAELDVNPEMKLHSTEYFPTPFYIARKVFKLVKSELVDCVFIDFGSGAGRMLMFVSQFGPKRIIGVEFSQSLCDKAIANLTKYFKSKPNLSNTWEIEHCDALDYEIRPQSNVFFLYDPFDSNVMRRIIQRILLSVQEHQRNIMVIYISPVYRKLFIEMGFSTVHSEVNKYDKGFVVLKLTLDVRQ